MKCKSSKRALQGAGVPDAGTPHAGTQPTLIGSLTIVAGLLTLGALTHRSASQTANPVNEAPRFREPLKLQLLRAREPGRGRNAPSPAHIPWKGWKDIFWRTVTQVSDHRLLAISAGVVFYGLLALFPAISALVSAYGLFAPPQAIATHLSFAEGVLPADVYSIIQDQIGRVVAKGDANLSLAFLLGFALALWSANAGVKAVVDALNVVYDETEKRGFIKLTLVSLAFTAGMIIATLVAVGAVVVTPLVLQRFGLGALAETVVRLSRWPVLMIGMLIGLAVLYRWGPSRREARWKWLSVGAIFATVAWFGGSAALSYYLANIAHYNVTYGSLGAAIGTMMWLWMSAIVVLLGAAINSEIEHQTAVDTTVGHAKPLGARGAKMADTVGAAQGA